MTRAVLLLSIILLLGAASAQTSFRVGVVVSSTGALADQGRLQAFAAERVAAAWRSGGVFGLPFEVELRDDASDPARAEALAIQLAADGVAAVVCCTSAAATERVSAALEALGVPLMALTEAGGVAGRYWSFALLPDERAKLTAVAVDAAGQSKVSLALMTLNTAYGQGVVTAFGQSLADTSLRSAEVVTYPPDAQVLTPEALWVATRQPGGVVAWGLPNDLRLAVDGLRRRGYTGLLYARAEAMPEAIRRRLHPSLDGAVGTVQDPWLGVRVAVAPASLAARLPPEHPHAAAVTAFLGRVVAGDPRAQAPSELETLARIDDALVLLHAAFEQVAAWGVGQELSSLRLATRDALVGAPPMALAAGSYDALEGQDRMVRWQGLVVAEVGHD